MYTASLSDALCLSNDRHAFAALSLSMTSLAGGFKSKLAR